MGARAVVTALLAACAAATVACAPAPAPASPPAAPAAPPAHPVPSAASAAGRPDHVVIVMLENENEADVLAEAPYLAALGAAGATFTDMHAEAHPSQPNYLALFSGDTQGVDDDRCPVTFDAPNLGSALTAAGYGFAGYSEDLPAAGFGGCRAGDYVRRHSPWASFGNLPAAANQPLSAMPTDYAALPTVSFVIPNLCHDMHNCSIPAGDDWLRRNVDGYARWARSHNSLLIVSFDESESDRDRDNHIATVAVGQRVPVGPITPRTDHYGLLRTLEDLYGLPALGRSAQAAPVPGLWQTGS